MTENEDLKLKTSTALHIGTVLVSVGLSFGILKTEQASIKHETTDSKKELVDISRKLDLLNDTYTRHAITVAEMSVELRYVRERLEKIEKNLR